MSLLRRSVRRAPQLSPLSLRHRRTFASRIDIPFTPPPVPVIEKCPVPTCPCSAAPDGLQIEREQNINGSMAAYAEQVLLCTGRSDWASRIETEENADGEIVRQLKSFLGPNGKFSDPYHNVMLTNSSIQSSASPTHQNERSSQTASTSRSIPAAKPGKDPSIAREQDAPAIPPASAFLLPSFQYVPTIPTEASAVEAFCKGFVLPSQLHQSHDKLSREQKNILKRQPELQKQFIGARKVDEILVLICGHGGRDERCGSLGPILQKEFEDKLQRQNIALLHDPPVAEAEEVNTDVEGYVPTARTGLISHIGGHKWAGNVIVYIPPSFASNPLAGKGIWYGRVGPEHVEGIVAKTIMDGKVIKELFRGGIDQNREIIRLSQPQTLQRWPRNYASETAKSKHEDNPKRAQRASGSYTSVFATLALSAAIGWAFHEYSGDGKGTTSTPGEFVRYTLVGKEEVSSTCSIFTLRPAAGTSIDTAELYDKRAISSVQFKQPQLQIARAYTILPPIEGQDPLELRFLIRKERNGEVSGYLHRLQLGADIEVRGPSVDYVLPEKIGNVMFLAGGTGIAPAIQIASKVDDGVDVHILWACRQREDCAGGVSDTVSSPTSWGWNLFGWFGGNASSSERAHGTTAATSEANAVISQLDALKQKQAGALRTDYFVDEEGSVVQPKTVTRLLQQVAAKPDNPSSPADRLLIVSGPDGFVNHWAGPKQWVGGREVQGPLGGVLSTLDLHGYKVIKLSMQHENEPKAFTSANGGDEEVGMDPIEPVQTNNVRPECFSSTFQEVLFVLTATMAIAMGVLVVGSVTVTSSFIGRDLDMTTAQITWITAANSLTNGAFLLFFGKIADLFGRKMLFVGSIFLFAVFCLAAGFSQTPMQIDVINGLIGLTGASAVPPAVGILGIVYEKPSKRKNYAFACFSAGNPMGFVCGTIAGGIATTLLGWRASYWFFAIVGLAFFFIGLWTIPKDTTAKEPLNRETLFKFDVIAMICVIFGVGMFSAALSLGESAPQGWKTGYVLALLIVGLFLLVAFVVWDCYYKFPLVPMDIWKDRNFSVCMAILVLGFMAFTPGSFFIALYFQDVWHQSAIMVAVRLLPMAIAGILVNLVAGLVLHRVSNKLLMLIGTSGYAAAFILLSVQRHDTSYWALCFPAFILLVVGADLEFNVANMYVMSSMPPSQQSIAGGIFQTVAKLSMTIGFGIATAVFSAVEKNPSLAIR
ncbi:putative transporter [Hortaea werneckii]|nr:putative transporter [Hortaea werneckii]KAI7058229.1 putative transporter [Hortaea werneckii]